MPDALLVETLRKARRVRGYVRREGGRPIVVPPHLDRRAPARPDELPIRVTNTKKVSPLFDERFPSDPATHFIHPMSERSPREIDEQLATLWRRLDPLLNEESRLLEWIEKWSNDPTTSERFRQQQQESLERARTAITPLREAIEPLEAEYRRRGWSRFFEALSTPGHVHRSMNCPTCNRMGYRTRFAWHPEMSGKTEQEAVAEFGEAMCTVCFPSAPTMPGYAGGSVRARRTEAARAEREAARASRRAAQAAKAITNPDGTPLREAGRGGMGSVIGTEVTARQRLVDALIYGEIRPGQNPDFTQSMAETARRIVAALAHKTGKPEATIWAEYRAKALAKVRTWKAEPEIALIVQVEKAQSGYERESAKIRARAQIVPYPHRFRAAEWTHPNGHPRCRRCGQEERVGGMCERLAKALVSIRPHLREGRRVSGYEQERREARVVPGLLFRVEAPPPPVAAPATVAAPPSGSIEAQIATIMAEAGLRLGTLDDLPPHTPATMKFRVLPLTPDHLLMARGVAAAIQRVAATKGLEQLAALIRREVPILFAAFSPEKAGMLTGTGGGRCCIVVNTAYDMRAAMFLKRPPGALRSYGGDVVDAMVSRGQVDEAMLYLSTNAAIHEMGHVYDGATGGKFGALFEMILYAARVGTEEGESLEWIHRSLSGYALAGGPVEAAAEAFTIGVTGTLPPELSLWWDVVVGQRSIPDAVKGVSAIVEQKLAKQPDTRHLDRPERAGEERHRESAHA